MNTILKQVLVRKLQLILNKVTPMKLRVLIHEVLNLMIYVETITELTAIVNLIFERVRICFQSLILHHYVNIRNFRMRQRRPKCIWLTLKFLIFDKL